MPSSLIAAALALQAPTPPNADAYVGHWNLRITDASDTFVSGGCSTGGPPCGASR